MRARGSAGGATTTSACGALSWARAVLVAAVLSGCARGGEAGMACDGAPAAVTTGAEASGASHVDVVRSAERVRQRRARVAEDIAREERRVAVGLPDAVAPHLEGFRLLLIGDFVPAHIAVARAPQRLWMAFDATPTGDPVVLVEDGERVLLRATLAAGGTPYGREIGGGRTRAVASFVADLDRDGARELIVELEDDEACVGAVVVLGWDSAGEPLLEPRSEHVGALGWCEVERHERRFAEAAWWWPERDLAPSSPPSFEIVEGEVTWYGHAAVWRDGRFSPAPAAQAAWEAASDAQVEARIAEGRGVAAMAALRSGASDALRGRVEEACEAQIFRTSTLVQAEFASPDDRWAVDQIARRGGLAQLEWALRVVELGGQVCGWSEPLRAAQQSAIEALVLARVDAGERGVDELVARLVEPTRSRVLARIHGAR